MRKSVLAAMAAVAVMGVGSLTVHAADQTMPAVGQPAPRFTLPSQTGAQISLSSFKGRWVVLYFYPKDMTPGCTIEAHNFQRDLALYEAKNAVILGVSLDTADSHQQFCTKEGLTFRLLSDPKHTVVDAYGSLGSFGATQIANRNTFLIDPQGNIAKEWTKVNPQTTSTEVLAAIPGGTPVAHPAAAMEMDMAKPTQSVKPPQTSAPSVKPPQ